MTELRIGAPNEKQRRFLLDRHRHIAYGGARGGGKSWAVRTKAKLLALRYAGIKLLIVRRTLRELQNNHIDPLRQELAGKLSAFTGNSGVGKSTLLNALAPQLERQTGGISQKLGRGRHTTREVEIFEVCGGLLADTPGFASLDANKICRIPPEELQHAFPEFEPYFGQCRFTGCSHRSEKGCAVRAALEEGKLSDTRYQSYLTMYEEASQLKEWER